MRSLNRKPIMVSYEVYYIDGFMRKSTKVNAPELDWSAAKQAAIIKLDKLGIVNPMIVEAKRIYA